RGTMTRIPLRRTRTVAPHLEQLEDRSLPSCTISTQGSTLVIRGSAGVDNIRIGDDGTGNINVVCDPEPTVRHFAGITAIKMNLLAGKDSVVYDLLGNANTGRTIRINLGAGADTCQVFLNNSDILGQAAYLFNVRGGAGKDNLQVTTADDPDT